MGSPAGLGSRARPDRKHVAATAVEALAGALPPIVQIRTSKRLSSGCSCRSGVSQARRASMRRAPRARGGLLPHPANGLRRDPEPHLLPAVRGERGTEPEDPPVGFPGRVPTRFVQKYTARGSGGAGRRARRRTAARTGPGARQRGPGRPHRGSRARVRRRRVPRPGLYPVRRVRCSCGRPAPRARAPRECARRSRSRCARPAARSSGLSMECGFGVFPDRYGPRNPSCSVVPNCSARTCVSS